METSSVSPSKSNLHTVRATTAPASPPRTGSPTRKLPPSVKEIKSRLPDIPLDFSFMNLNTVMDIVKEEPISGRKRGTDSPEKPPSPPKKVDGLSEDEPYSPPVSIRLNDNGLTQLDDLDAALAAVFEEPSRLQWIDLSGNAISKIPEKLFLPYTELSTLHLHANNLSLYSDIDSLQCLTRLRQLTLHGNPVEEKKHYRNYTIFHLPSLVQLDYSTITRADRERAETWSITYRKNLYQQSFATLLITTMRRQLTRRITVNELIEIQWGITCRVPLLLWVYLQHALTFIFFGLIGVMHLNMDHGMIVAMESYANKASGIVLILVALLHLVPFLPPRWLRSKRLKRSSFWPKICHFRKLRIPINVQISLNHFIAVACETYMAYDMSRRIVNSNIAALYAILLALNCICTSWLLFLRHSGSKLILISIVDSAISFALSAGFPFFFLVIPLIEFTLTSNRAISHSLHWFAHLYSTSRTLCVSSLLALLMRILPGLTNYLVLRRVAKSLSWGPTLQLLTQNMHQNMSSVGPTDSSTNSNKMAQAFTTKQGYGRLLKLVFMINIIWGFLVAMFGIKAAFNRVPCPPYCVYSSAPWFSSTCNCIYALFNCQEQNVNGSTVDKYFDPTLLGENLVFLHVQQCSVPHGIELNTITQFQSLYGIKLDYTNLVNWDISGTELPDSVMLFDIHYSQLTKVPKILSPINPKVRWIYLVGNMIQSIPLEIWQSWYNAMSIWLSENQLREIPHGALQVISGLEILALNNNQLLEIPENELIQLSSLNTLYLEVNQISKFPSSLIQANSNLRIYLNHNPILSIPSTFNTALSSMKVQVASTPFCFSNASFSVQICYQDCAPTCGRIHLFNYLCDHSCNTSTCNFDQGDCIDS
ncbi:hypothetical protein THRCLA_01223 [Thraustotheca clavata]|uniref:Leucine-rich repeat-containing protein 51 n=1 Tax=Thraustotheca clavata TaxID=74557 RepID=A0A1W0A8X5_9STRA|nr:hypothetical protein THRCLA_01223 [Thraustotheca clavata]